MVVMTQSLITLKRISKSYPGVIAADDVSLDLYPGEVVGLVGKNGAGKSTIIRMIAGVEEPDHGIIAVNGQPFASLDAHQAIELGVATVHQEINDVPILSVAENIALGLGYPKRYGCLIDKQDLHHKSADALAQIHMDINPAHKLSTLSIAERRMVMIARALVNRAKVLILDEPTASLTNKEIIELKAVIRKLRAQGVCIVYVSHRLQEILDLTDRVIVMRNGRVVSEKATDNLDEGSLISLIAGRQVQHQNDNCKTNKQLETNRDVLLEVQGLDPFDLGVSDTLELHRGEILGLAGLAGSGRTELLRQIVGADHRSKVCHRVASRRLEIRNPADALKCGIAIVPEDRRNEGAILNFSITRNISLSSLRMSRLLSVLPIPSIKKENSRSRELMAKLSVKAPSGSTITSTLSGGNQQKVVFARCLAAEADILILDEPTHGIDVDAKEEIYELIKSLAADGKGIILVSSDLQELINIVDRAIVMREGAFVGKLEGKDLSEKRVLELCFQTSEIEALSC